MNVKHRSILGLVIIILAIIFALVFRACNGSILNYLLVTQTDFEIDGFSDKLNTALKDEYGFTVPENAEFLEGIMMLGPKDPSMKIIFSISKEELSKSMDANWKTNPNAAQVLIGEEESQSCYKRSNDKKSARLFVTRPDSDGKIKVLLWCYNPSKKWIK